MLLWIRRANKPKTLPVCLFYSILCHKTNLPIVTPSILLSDRVVTSSKVKDKAQVLVARNQSPPPLSHSFPPLFSIKFLYYFISFFRFLSSIAQGRGPGPRPFRAKLQTGKNRIFPISSLSFFFLPCFVIFALNYASMSVDFY